MLLPTYILQALANGSTSYLLLPTCHQALANGSTSIRPVIYLLLARRWFRDCDNWPDVAVSQAFGRVRLAALPTPMPTPLVGHSAECGRGEGDVVEDGARAGPVGVQMSELLVSA